MSSLNIVERFSVPNKFEPGKYGQICMVITDDDRNIKYYIQCSHDENSPNWVSVGEILEKTMFDKWSVDPFMEKCLNSYNKF